MNLAYRTLFAGMLAIVFCSTAIAHDRYDNGWSGGVTIAVTPGGDLSWQGGLSYRPVMASPYRVVTVPRAYHEPMCHHPSHHRPVIHRKGYKHGRKHRVIHVYH